MSGKRYSATRSIGEEKSMLKIDKKYVVNEDNETVAVLLDLKTFQQIESLLEDQLLSKSIEEVVDEKALPLGEARTQYAKLKKTR
jgi:RelB Antitoxin alpha helical domain